MSPLANRNTRRLRAVWRDTGLLLREFRRTLFVFSALILFASLLYFHLARQGGEEIISYSHAVYQVLALSFLQSSGDFPEAWYLQVFYFGMPILGASALARGVADFGLQFFNRRARSKEWQMAVSSTMQHHIILIGLGHLGFQVVRQLHRMEQEIVVIEQNPKADLVSRVQALDIPVLQDDGTRESALEAAGVRRARSIVLCTQNDSLNLQMAVKARSLNPGLDVVIRIFDDDFASALQEQFGFNALSGSGMAAPAFAAAAAGVDMTRPITVEGKSLSLARMHVDPHSRLLGLSVAELEAQFELSVVLLRHAGEPDLHPAGDRQLSAGDVLAVLGEPAEISHLVEMNKSRV